MLGGALTIPTAAESATRVVALRADDDVAGSDGCAAGDAHVALAGVSNRDIAEICLRAHAVDVEGSIPS